MSVILNIETSSKYCSVAVTIDGGVDTVLVDDKDMNHAVFLAPAVKKCLDELKSKGRKLDAVAVSMGPGSYTGLRIGLSFAKGLCFAQDIPLIGINTLKLLAVKAQFSRFDWEGDELLVPMIDARRNEVYTAVYDFALNPLVSPMPLILEKDSLADALEGRKAIFNGDGSEKAKSLLKESDTYVFLNRKPATAADMLALAEKAFRESDFIDPAYSVPEYIKEYEAKISKNKVLENSGR